MSFSTYAELKAEALRQGLSPNLFELLLMKQCPHFPSCSAVDCPLDLLQGHRGPEEEEKRRARRATREKIITAARAQGYEFELRHGGLTRKEWVKEGRRARYRKQWEAMSEGQRALLLAHRFPAGATVAASPSGGEQDGTESETDQDLQQPETALASAPYVVRAAVSG